MTVAVPVPHIAGTAPHFTGMKQFRTAEKETNDGNEMMLIPSLRNIFLDRSGPLRS
jgi:hypothetical protein